MTDTWHFHFNKDPDPVMLSWQLGYPVWQPNQLIPVSEIQSYFSIDQLIAWANEDIECRGVEYWHNDTRYFLAQFVKINLLYLDLKRNPNRKPLLLRPGANKWDPLTGDTRLRACELMAENISLQAIVVAGSKPNMPCKAIETQSDFAQACDAANGTPFWLRVGPQGLEWYEMAVDVSCTVTGQRFSNDARETIIQYVTNQGPGFRFDRDWFCWEHSWA